MRLEPCCKVYHSDMDVTLLYFHDCPNWLVANEHLAALASGDLRAF